jgi:hypothetical protein
MPAGRAARRRTCARAVDRRGRRGAGCKAGGRRGATAGQRARRRALGRARRRPHLCAMGARPSAAAAHSSCSTPMWKIHMSRKSGSWSRCCRKLASALSQALAPASAAAARASSISSRARRAGSHWNRCGASRGPAAAAPSAMARRACREPGWRLPGRRLGGRSGPPGPGAAAGRRMLRTLWQCERVLPLIVVQPLVCCCRAPDGLVWALGQGHREDDGCAAGGGRGSG